MSISSPDSEKYLRAIADMANLVKVFGAREVLLDLRQFFPDQYEEMLAALDRGLKTKQLARLLDASESGRRRIGVAYSGMVVDGSNCDKGDQ